MIRYSKMIALATLVISSSALAETTATSGTTSAEASSFLKKTTMSYSGMYLGHGVSKWKATQTNADGSDGDPQVVVNTLIGGYKVTDTLGLGIALNANVNPVYGMSASGVNPQLRLLPIKLIKTDQLSASADLRITVPALKTTRDKGLNTTVRTAQSTSYSFRDSRFSLGVDTYLQGSSYTTGENQDLFRVYFAPNVSYQATPTLSGTVLLEWAFAHKRGMDNLMPIDGPMDIEPMINWAPTEMVSISPLLNLYPTNLTLDSSSMGAYVSWKLL